MNHFVFRETTISAEATIAPPLQDTTISTDEQMTTTSKPTGEETDATMAPTTDAVHVDSPLSTITPSIAGMTNLFETTATTMTGEPATTTHLTTMSEAIETNSVILSDTTTDLTPVSGLSTMAQIAEAMTLPATTNTMPMSTANQDSNEMMQSPIGFSTGSTGFSTGPTSFTTTNFTSLAALFGSANLTPGDDLGLPNESAGHAEVDNVLTMSSNEETTRMATSTDSKTDRGDKPTVPLSAVTESPPAAVTEPPPAVVTEPPPKSQDSNELDNGNSGGPSISTSIVVFSLAVLYVIV